MALARRTHPRKEQDDEEEDEEVTGEVVEDIMGTNANTVILEGEPHAGLFAEFSRLNHACSPNAFYRFVPQRLTLDVIAYRDIEAGEEITINCVQPSPLHLLTETNIQATDAPLGLPFAARQEHIRATWAFHCTCPLCSKLSANPELIPESDARRARLVAGRHEMAAAYSQGDVLHSLGLAAELRKLSEQEGMNPIAAEYDELLAGMRLEGGDIWAADVIGRRAMAEWAKFTGADSWENVRRVREWMADEIEAGYDR